MLGMIGAEALLVDGKRATHQRLGFGEPLVSCRSCARLLRPVATLGAQAPARSSMAIARRKSGSASASRPVG